MPTGIRSMPYPMNESKEWIVWAVRSAMIGLSGVAIALLTYFGQQMVVNQERTGSSLQRVEQHLINTNSDIKLLQQEMVLRRQQQDSRDDNVRVVVQDHEARIRYLERGKN